MHNFNNEIYHVWRPELDSVVKFAIQQRSRVEVRSHMALDKCNYADVTLTGRFLGIRHYQAQFLVESFDLDLARNFPVSPECEYNFATTLNSLNTGNARIEYGGRALVLDSELQRNNIPAGLLLRLFIPTCIRRLRMHERLDCADDFIGMPGLMVIGSAPANRRKLLALLGHYYKDKKRPRPELVNISAGGVCLQIQDQHCQRFLGTDEKYLFFFFSGNSENIKCPSVFVCKKVGLFRDNEAKCAGIRLRFLKELVWENPEEDLKWQDVNDSGSATIKRIIESKK